MKIRFKTFRLFHIIRKFLSFKSRKFSQIGLIRAEVAMLLKPVHAFGGSGKMHC